MILLYDGTLEGYFTAIFVIFREKISLCDIQGPRTFEPDLFQPARTIISDTQKAYQVLRGLRERISLRALNIIIRAFLSEAQGVENLLRDFIKLGLRIGPTVTDHLADPVVNMTIRWSLRVFREYHRWLGLVRFRELTDGSYYAPIEPEGSILPLLPPHFMDRFPGQRWIIHDMRRSTALLHHGGKMELVRILDSPGIFGDSLPLSEEERFYSRLWRRYYEAISIETRKNPGLRLQFMPKKTWKYLPELAGTLGMV